jgi:hypothetical protein
MGDDRSLTAPHILKETHMRKLMLAAALTGGALLGTPQAARADCLIEAVDSCNGDFPASQKELVAIRGWCYLIRAGMCRAGF